VFDREHSFGRMYKIIPKKKIKELRLAWPIPHEKDVYKKSAEFLEYVIGSEG